MRVLAPEHIGYRRTNVPKPKLTLKERLLAHIKINEQTGCWEWTGSKKPAGYGQISIPTPKGAYPLYAHRVAYEIYKGPIPDGYETDHLCRNRGCVNPDHLEAVPQEINRIRGAGSGGSLSPEVINNVCQKGHPRTPASTGYFTLEGRRRRFCKICYAINRDKYREDINRKYREKWHQRYPNSTYRKRRTENAANKTQGAPGEATDPIDENQP